jgi:putative FmdB family regulatory protein
MYEYVCESCEEHHLSKRRLDLDKKKDRRCPHCGKYSLRRVWVPTPFVMK